METVDGTLDWIADGKFQAAKTGARIDPGKILRANGEAGAVLALADGSRVEMRSQSELALQTAADGVLLQLNGGSIIVTAAKQRNGHLYVRTKDVTVSVVGTVFFVNAEQAGSRVAVIQGEVHVQQGTTGKTLLPGEQVATSSAMPSIPMVEEISWSRNVQAHLAFLERAIGESPQGPVSAIPARLQFVVASIKPHSGLSPHGEPLGFVCHGTDGTRRASIEYSGSTDRVTAPQGRCVGSGVLLGTLIGFAFGVPIRDVSGVPDWARLRSVAGGRAGTDRGEGNAFQIEAAAEDPLTASAEQLRQMVQAMLSDRFKLKVHRETQESSGYALVIAKNGPKLKLKEPSDREEPPSLEVNNAGRPVIRGKSTLDELARFLSGGPSNIGAPVVDKTGLTGIYDYEFAPSIGGGGGGQRGGPPQGQPPRPPSEMLADILRQIPAERSAALEDQLGLRLQPEKAVPTEIIVIDQVEKPSTN